MSEPLVRRALVTGGSGDLGAAICRRLARGGLHVIVHANRNAARAEAIVEDLRRDGFSAESAAFDVTEPQATRDVLEKLLQAGPIQVLISNAGSYSDAPMAGMSLAQWRRPIEVSLDGFFNVAQPLLLPMMGTRWGRIIAISSVAGIIGNRGQTNYAAAKAGLTGAVKSLALELATRGVTVNAVAPGVIAGRITEREFDADAIKRLVPMRRAGTPEEVAALVAFLASEEAGYISGQVISINGAMA
jgi:3-oxoacyl-[acyl-carrier protein] reductase